MNIFEFLFILGIVGIGVMWFINRKPPNPPKSKPPKDSELSGLRNTGYKSSGIIIQPKRW